MTWLRLWIGVLVLTAALAVPATLRACPACAEAIAASADMEDVDDFPQAMNHSIYLMIAVPYTTLALGGFFVYRGLKANSGK
jgi:hypothetical protein